MAKFNVQTRHYGSGCFSFFLSSQVHGLLFFFTDSMMSIFLKNWGNHLLTQLEPPSDSCRQSLLNKTSVNESVARIPPSFHDLFCNCLD